MPNQTRLKVLLQQRYWQTYRTFCVEYDRAAASLDRELVGTFPSKAQFHRWMSGDIRTTPYPDACRVLEAMFPGWRIVDMFDKAPAGDEPRVLDLTTESGLLEQLNVGRGLAPQRVGWRTTAGQVTARSPSSIDLASTTDMAGEVSRRLAAVSRVQRFSGPEIQQLAALTGALVDLDLTIDIDIRPDGKALVTYTHEVLNLSDLPLTRIPRDLWFEHTTGRLDLRALPSPDRRIAVQRLHDTPSSSQFAIQFSPPVRPGETATASWTCDGVRFIQDHYWRQNLPRHVRHLTINIRQRGGEALTSCSAIEGHPGGSENSIQESLMWDQDGDDVLITLTRDYLDPNQFVTLRWEVAREPTP